MENRFESLTTIPKKNFPKPLTSQPTLCLKDSKLCLVIFEMRFKIVYEWLFKDDDGVGIAWGKQIQWKCAKVFWANRRRRCRQDKDKTWRESDEKWRTSARLHLTSITLAIYSLAFICFKNAGDWIVRLQHNIHFL